MYEYNYTVFTKKLDSFLVAAGGELRHQMHHYTESGSYDPDSYLGYKCGSYSISSDEIEKWVEFSGGIRLYAKGKEVIVMDALGNKMEITREYLVENLEDLLAVFS